MNAIFGVVGRAEASEFEAMGARLMHRGTTLVLEEVAPNVKLGCVTGESKSGILRYRQFIGVSDCWICDTPGVGNGAGSHEFDQHYADDQLLAAYSRSGAKGLSDVNGQFSLAAWDDAKKELFLARDYAGMLPLYYFQLPSGGVVFASEYKALLALGNVPAEPDLEMVQRLQYYKHLPSDKNMLRGFRSVPPGAVLTFSADGRIESEYRFPLLSHDVSAMTMEQSQTAVTNAFTEAIKVRVSGLRKIGVALSGGIDSIGVAYACRLANPDAELHTFTAGHGPDDPEMRTASYVAEKIGSVHHNVVVTAEDVVANVPLVVWHLENPIARSETLQFFRLGQEAGKHVDNMLTGAAADGLFAGMPKHKILWLMNRFSLLRGAA